MNADDGVISWSIPAEFERWESTSPFLQQLSKFGPIYRHVSGDVLALRVTGAHTNMHSVAHGGLLATLVDCAIGHRINNRLNVSVVTAQMSITYLQAARENSWLEVHTQIDRQGRKLIFATCVLKADGEDVLKATAVFAVRRPSNSQS